MENWQIGGFGLYVHWPFCASKCPYCDFNSHVSATIDQARWKAAYLSALDHYAGETAGRVLTSIYFGGGTPSLMYPGLVAAIIDRAGTHWTFANDIEISLEANPTSVEAGRFAGFREAGVNRVSVGVQALNDVDLKDLGRLHSVSEALSALEVARNTFDRISFDLIYARQNQSLDDWRAELERALSFNPDHLSLYQLTIEDGTAFGDRYARGKLPGLPSEDSGADMYFLTQELCEVQDLFAYEVSNHAKLGQESRHNLIYWRSGDYVGIGPGAHGRLTSGDSRMATDTPLAPEAWLECVETGSAGESSRRAQSTTDRGGEYLFMGLRTSEGISVSRYEAMSKMAVNYNKIKELAENDLVNLTDDTLSVTTSGRPILNAVLRELLPD